METTWTSTPCASMSFMRSSGVKRTFGELNAVRLPPPSMVPSPSPGSWRKPYHSRPASAACHRDFGTRCAWMSMLFMGAFSLVGLEVEQTAGRGLDPFLRGLLVEHEPLVGGSDAPGPGRHLGIEPAGAPACIAQTEDGPPRTGAADDRL